MQVSTLFNGVVVATQDTKLPVATIGVVVGAGSRHESSATSGATAYLKATAFQSNADFSAFAITREAEAIGAKLSVLSGRDFIAYYATTTRDNVAKASQLIASAATDQLFHPWEVSEVDDAVTEAREHATHDKGAG